MCTRTERAETCIYRDATQVNARLFPLQGFAPPGGYILPTVSRTDYGGKTE